MRPAAARRPSPPSRRRAPPSRRSGRAGRGRGCRARSVAGSSCAADPRQPGLVDLEQPLARRAARAAPSRRPRSCSSRRGCGPGRRPSAARIAGDHPRGRRLAVGGADDRRPAVEAGAEAGDRVRREPQQHAPGQRRAAAAAAGAAGGADRPRERRPWRRTARRAARPRGQRAQGAPAAGPARSGRAGGRAARPAGR